MLTLITKSCGIKVERCFGNVYEIFNKNFEIKAIERNSEIIMDACRG